MEEVIRKLVNNPKFKTEIQKHIGQSIDTQELDREHTGLQERLKQVTGAKNKLANQMDNLSVSDKHYDKKYEDMQVRLDKLYDEIEEIETLIEEVETTLAKQMGESRMTIQRYIRLTNLIPKLPDMVDEGKIAFTISCFLKKSNHKG